MSSVEGDFVGRFSFALAPYFRWFLERWAQPDVRKGVCRKSAQVGWTQSAVNNVLGWIVHLEKSTAIAMFPKEGSARNFDREKFEPMCEATPELGAILPPKSRTKDVTALFKSFPGGFVKFVGSNSIADVKSTSARRLVVEEPDDCNLNLRGQGDAIKLLEERGKTFRDVKILIGGTPSIRGVSSIDDEIAHSDQNLWLVPCPECGTHQALEWENVTWLEDAEVEHQVFGRARPETARYRCASCGTLWTDAQKNAAVLAGHAEPQAPFRGVLGLSLNELYSLFPGSRLSMLVERLLVAKREEQKGELGALIAFWNAALGRSWEYQSGLPSEEEIAERGLDYAAYSVPAGGLVLTMGVDVQHNRIAVVIRAWGRGEESWLVLFDEIEGNTPDRNDRVWQELDRIVFGKYPNGFGTRSLVRAVSIDSSDGVTSDAVYSWVRGRSVLAAQRGGMRLMAIKGAVDAKAEIFVRARPPIDTNAKNTKAARYGLAPFMVGVGRAKDLLLGDGGGGRLRLDGIGPGRFHWYRDVRADYIEQLTAEVKVPTRSGKRIWQLKKGRRNEALDCEVYALHAARALKTHLMREEHWVSVEQALRQAPLFAEPAAGGERVPRGAKAGAEASTSVASNSGADDAAGDGVASSEQQQGDGRAPPEPEREVLVPRAPSNGGFVNRWR